jgi:hypothetical protein
MNFNSKRIPLALVLAFGVALLLAMPVFAEDVPPPEAPAEPIVAAPAAPDEPAAQSMGGESVGAPLGAAGGVNASALRIWFEVGGLLYDDYGTLQEAINGITLFGLPGDRTIHVEAGNYDTDVDYQAELNGAQPYLAQVKAIKGVGGFPNNEGAPVFTGGLTVTGTTAGFTLEGLQFDRELLFQNNTGTVTLTYVDIYGGDGALTVEDHNGTVKRDSVNLSGGGVANLDNTASASAGMTIFNSAFNGHGGTHPGLAINTRGMATLTGVSANYNGGNGATISAKGGVKVVHGLFNGNNAFGLEIRPGTGGEAASVYLEDIAARDNAWSGVGIFSATGGVTIKQAGLSNNGWRGLTVSGATDDDPIASAVTLVDVGAYGNGNEGIYLRTNGTATLTRVTAQGNQGVSGIYITTPGAITLNSINASDNTADGVFGAILDNQFDGSTKGVTITNTYYRNSFSNNRGNGLWIRTNGAVSIKGLDANNNRIGDNDNGYGIFISGGAASNVTLTDVNADNNDQYGVKIATAGTITWKGGGANNNGDDNVGERFGALLENQYASATKAVTLGNLNFDGNRNGSGLTVHSKGAINIKTSGASWNDGFGMDLSSNFSGGNGAISVLSSATQGNEFNGNGEHGLKIQATGAVSLAYLNARENIGKGFDINNTYAVTAAPVKLTNLDAGNNVGDGIYVETKGAVTASNLNSSGNGGTGVNIDASAGTGAVKVLRTAHWHNYFSDNDGEGLSILARGAITLARLMANNNGGLGAYIDNCLAQPDNTCLGNGGVTFQITPGWNHEFSGNGGLGLYVQSKGAISISNVNANNNAYIGVVLDNNWVGANGTITIGSVGGGNNNFSQNGGSGLLAFSTGAISLSQFEANNNYGYGVHLNNAAATSAKPVTVLNGNTSDNTNGDGLRISSKGNIKVTSVSADRNDGRDMWLNDGESVAERLRDYNAAEGDAWKFTLDEAGTTNTELHLYNNFEAVLSLQYYDGATESWLQYGSATVSGVGVLTLDVGILPAGDYRILVQGSDDSQYGDYVLSFNDPWNDNLQRNGASGFDLSNSYDGGAGTITLLPGATQSQVVANENSATGIIAFSRKAVTLGQMHADGNGGRGVVVDNCLWDDDLGACAATAPVTLKGNGSGFFNNTWDGMFIYTNGAANLVNLAAGDNGHGYDASPYRWNGVYIVAAGNVSIKTTGANQGVNWFGNNGDTGLVVSTAGTITIDKAIANQNGGQGGWLDNYGAVSPKAVTVTNSSFDDNGYGLDIYTTGAVTLKKMQTNNNAYDGTWIWNYDTIAPVSIIQSDFSGNQDGYGISVDVLGNITWNSSSANGNAEQGAWLDNDDGIGTVTLLGSYGLNNFYNNQDIGLEIESFNSVSVNSVRAGFGAMGAYINAQGPVTISNSIFENSWENGLKVEGGFGNLSLNNVSVFRNALDSGGDYAGAILTAQFGNIFITNSNFSGNGDAGLSLGWNAPFFYSLTNTTYYGNNMDDDGSPNFNLVTHVP